jgi:D-alanine-D-alanine ligase
MNTQAKLNIAILFGGRSAEHEVSIQSAKNIFTALDKEKYNPILIGIDQTGKWRLYPNAEAAFTNKSLSTNDKQNHEVALLPAGDGKLLDITEPDNQITLDAIFVILHGPYGEDGTVQGLFKLANVPFVGAGVLGSAVGMDKDVMKRLLREAGLPIGKFLTVKATNELPSFDSITEKLNTPCFVKPANMGSSVGISKVNDESEYLAAMEMAFQYDNKVIVEEYIEGREIECAVLGNDHVIASLPGEIVLHNDFYSYKAKYINKTAATLQIPADLPNELVKAIQTLAIKTFQTLDCAGMGRVDFFLTTKNELIVNEINTLPGFTQISMYPKLWEASGVNYTELINKLIQFALEKFDKEQELKTNK